MNKSHDDQPHNIDDGKPSTVFEDTATPAERSGKHTKSMHDGVPVWCDCCSCEAEPYWVAIGKELEAEISSHWPA